MYDDSSRKHQVTCFIIKNIKAVKWISFLKNLNLFLSNICIINTGILWFMLGLNSIIKKQPITYQAIFNSFNFLVFFCSQSLFKVTPGFGLTLNSRFEYLVFQSIHLLGSNTVTFGQQNGFSNSKQLEQKHEKQKAMNNTEEP